MMKQLMSLPSTSIRPVLALRHEHILTPPVDASHTILCLKDKGVPREAGRTLSYVGLLIPPSIRMDTISLSTLRWRREELLWQCHSSNKICKCSTLFKKIILILKGTLTIVKSIVISIYQCDGYFVNTCM